jgi:hypothetical protein
VVAPPAACDAAQALARGTTIYRELLALGASPDGQRWPQTAVAGGVTARLGAQSRADRSPTSTDSACPVSHDLNSRTARCGPACRVVWQGVKKLGNGSVLLHEWANSDPLAGNACFRRRGGQITAGCRASRAWVADSVVHTKREEAVERLLGGRQDRWARLFRFGELLARRLTDTGTANVSNGPTLPLAGQVEDFPPRTVRPVGGEKKPAGGGSLLHT